MNMDIRLRQKEDIAIIDIEGTIDIDSAELIETAGALVKDNKLKLICNFERVDFVDYNGLSVLAIMYKEVINYQGQIKFCNVALHIIELLRVVKLDEVFQIYENIETAIKSFREEPAGPMLKRPLRRRFKRLSVEVCAEYGIYNASGEMKSSFVGKVTNISGAGMFISSPKIFPTGTHLNLNVYLHKDAPALRATGVVAWLADKDLQPYSHPGMGVQFYPVDTKVQAEIVDFIEKNITHRSEDDD